MSRPRGAMDGTARADLLTLRRSNLGLVLQSVIGAGGLSRAEIGTQTGIGQSTVSSLVDELVARGILEERGAAHSGRAGRPRTIVGLADSSPCTVGLEIRVSHMRTCVVDLGGAVRAAQADFTDNRSESPDAVARRAASLVNETIAGAIAAGLRVRGVGVGAPGLVDPATGLVNRSPNLGWTDYDLAAGLSATLRAEASPVWVGCGADLEALAELHHGSGRAYRNFVLLSGDIGIGGGVVIEGSVYRGTTGGAGEVGHLCVEPGGRSCPCGNRGCLERYAGEEAILQAAGLPLWDVADPLAELVSRVGAGEPRARAALDEAGHYLGLGSALIGRVLAPDAVILSGSLARLSPWLLGPMSQAVRETRMTSSGPVLIASSLGEDIMALGAATVGLLDVIASPDRMPRRAADGAEPNVAHG